VPPRIAATARALPPVKTTTTTTSPYAPRRRPRMSLPRLQPTTRCSGRLDTVTTQTPRTIDIGTPSPRAVGSGIDQVHSIRDGKSETAGRLMASSLRRVQPRMRDKLNVSKSPRQRMAAVTIVSAVVLTAWTNPDTPFKARGRQQGAAHVRRFDAPPGKLAPDRRTWRYQRSAMVVDQEMLPVAEDRLGAMGLPPRVQVSGVQGQLSCSSG